MILQLSALPSELVRGVYTVRGVPGRMPDRALFLQPDAAHSFLDELAEVVTVSDVFRSAESSLAAVRASRGAKPPGYSGHNFGLSIDVDLAQVLASRPTWSEKGGKRYFDRWMAEHGWFCHRSDYAAPSWKPTPNEAWHYNFLPGHPWGKSSPAALEARIVELYGAAFVLDALAQQAALAKLLLYSGALDGDLGPLSKEALRAFQRTWELPETGRADARTQRTLAYVTAEVDVVP